MLNCIQAIFLLLVLLLYLASWLSQTRFVTIKLPNIAGVQATPDNTLGVAVLGHTLFMIYYGISQHHAPVSNFFEVLIFLAWCLIVVFFLIGLTERIQKLSKYILPIIICLFLVAFVGLLSVDDTKVEEGKIVLVVHIITILFALGLFFFNFITGVLYLVKDKQMKSRKHTETHRKLPPLETLDKLSLRSLLIGFSVLTIGVFLGAVYAQSRPDPGNWMLDIKFIISTLTWLFYGFVIHIRINSKYQGRRVPILSICGFSMLMIVFINTYLQSLS